MIRAVCCVALLVAGGSLVGEQAWLAAKARVAGALIERAFAGHLEDGARHRPWRWADTWPVARLAVPRLGVERVVLAGATGATLAFGPGHIDGTARPGAGGNVALAGHRDSWFAFLRDLERGDELLLETRDGVMRYRVVRLEVKDVHDGDVLADTGWDALTLVTCYPFRGPAALLGGPQRFVVTCTRIEDRGQVS